jgi:hypothetical protein
MKLTGICGIGLVLGVSLMTLTASAIPQRLDTPPYSPPAPVEPSNQGHVYNWLTALVNSYNTYPGPSAPLPAPDSTPLVDITTSSSPTSLAITVSGYAYLTVHWGNGQTAGDASQAWYIGSGVSTFTVVTPNQNGLSGYRLWNSVPNVPDGGMTLALLGFGLMSLGALRRRIC